jgi:formate dehydrogenase alpha subunit
MVTHVSLDDLALPQTEDPSIDSEPQSGAGKAKRCRLTINGKEIEARSGDTILMAARRAGIAIPSMCDDPRLKPTGDCGLCVVEVKGEEGLVKACKARAIDGLEVETETEPLKAERKRVLDKYLSNHNAYCLPPCEYKCPAGIDVAGYIDLIVQKKYVEATALIKEMLPLPGVLGRVCPRPCESVCRRVQVDGTPVAICALKRYAADKALEDGRPTQPVPKPRTGKRVAVVGSGPAGLSAAYYLGLEGHEVTILEALEQGGGTLRYGIPPYRLPHAVLDQEIDDILSLGVTLKTNQRMGRDYQIEQLRRDGFDSVFLGIGAMVGKPAKIEGEDAPGVMPAVDFLLDVNRGKRVPLGDRVIVIGGGFTAADAVRTARRQGAGNVTMMYRRTKKEMSAAAHEIHDCEVEGVKFDFLAAPVKIVVENGRATGLVAQRMKLGEPDSSGRRRPEPVPGSDYFTPADTILLAIGQDVDFAGLNEGSLAPSKWSTVNIDEQTMLTNLPGVFAGGDCVTGAATVVEAVAAGRQGAFAINAYLNGADERAIAAAIARQKPKFFDIGANPKSNAAMAETPVIEARERLDGFLKPDGSGSYDAAFAEVEHAFSDETAHQEAERCLQCRCQAAGTCSLQKYSLEYGAGTKMFKGDAGVFEPMVSWPFFELNREKCIRCMDCVRICDEVQHRKVYTSDDLGYPALVSGTFDFRDTECNNCGQCVGICPTGALKNLTDTGTLPKALRQRTTTICGYCGVGCAIDIETERGRVVSVSASNTSDANVGNLCVKGRFGMDFIHHPDRLKKPLIRRGGKNGKLEAASWPEAIDYVARRLNEVKAKYGPHALGGLCSARATNEDNYVFQKLVRCAFGTNNIDHCARLCHMASAVALKISVGSSAPSASAPDVGLADAFIIVGSNTTETHPVISSQVFRAKYNSGARVVVVDPRRIEMVDHADVWLRPRAGTNVAVLNAIAHVILEEGMANEDFIAKRTEGWEAYRASLAKYTPEYAAKVSDVPAERIVEAARIYGKAKRGMLLWGMGITQHLTGVDGALAMSNLSLITGHVGRPGTGFIPLRGQSNVQGCSDMQGQHNALPGYHSIKDPKDRAKFEKAWGVPMPDNPYKTVVEMEEGCGTGEIKAMFIMGENPMGSSPDIHEVEHGLRTLEFLVVQDIFLSETAELADVVLPAASFAEKDGTFTNTERRVQLVRPAVAPPGQARPDWKIVCDISTAMGYKMSYPNAAAIMEEIASLVPSYAGIRHERLGNGGLQWPCPDTEHPGTRFLYAESFPTPSGRGNFAVVEQDETADEVADDKYPLTLNTGRLLEHYHTGTMTRRSKGLDAMKPEGEVEVHPEDARRYGLTDGCRARIVTKRGAVDVKVWVTERTLEGAIFYPFHFGEAPANRLVGTRLDKQSFTPAFKRSAARLERIPA